MISDHRLRWVLLSIFVLVIASLGCGGTPRVGPTPTPAPFSTHPPTPTPAPSPTPVPSPTPQLTTIPEATSNAPEIVEFTDLILGVSAKGYNHYAMGSTAVMGGPEPYYAIAQN